MVSWYDSSQAMKFTRFSCSIQRKYSMANFRTASVASEPHGAVSIIEENIRNNDHVNLPEHIKYTFFSSCYSWS